jgi:hypothetical protein
LRCLPLGANSSSDPLVRRIAHPQLSTWLLCEHTFVPDYSFTVTEHDPDRPWIVFGREHRKVTLEDAVSFFEWAHEHWPAPRWTIDLDHWQLAPAWPR